MGSPDPFDPDGPQAEAARALRVGQRLGSHTYMYRPSRFVPSHTEVGSAPGAMKAAWEEASALFSEVIMASWDGFVSTIRDGRYTDLFQLRDSLERYRDPNWREVMKLELKRMRIASAHAELDRVRRRYLGGRRAEAPASPSASRPVTLFDALVPDATDPDHPAFHEFSRAGWGSTHETPDIYPNKVSGSFEEWEGRHNRPSSFYLAPRYSAEVGERREAEMEAHGLDPRAVWAGFEGFTFLPDDTFEEAHEDLRGRRAAVEVDLRTYRDAVEVMNLRLSILENVLYEHEVYGHVPLWDEMGDEEKRNREEASKEGEHAKLKAKLDELEGLLVTPAPRKSGHHHARANAPVIAAMKRAAVQLHGGGGAEAIREVRSRYERATGVPINRATVYDIAKNHEPLELSD